MEIFSPFAIEVGEHLRNTTYYVEGLKLLDERIKTVGLENYHNNLTRDVLVCRNTILENCEIGWDPINFG